MKKNVSGQKIGCQMVSATDGSAFTGSVTVAVTIDAGTQATGSVGSGACTHEGNGYHTYAPSQAETNGDLVAFTFTGTGAIPATVQVFTTFPQTGDSYAIVNDGTNGNAAIKTQVAAIETDTQDIQSRIGTPSNLGGGATLSANLSDIEAQTDDIGTAGAGLTAVPWNAAWDAEVQSECADALNAYDPPTNTEMVAAFTEIKGASWSSTDTLEAIRDRGDAAWVTATGFSTHSAADVWAVATRVLTAGTNIALAKGTGVTGFNDLDAAAVATAVWNAATATYGSAGSYGLLIETNLDAQVSSVGGGSLTVQDIVDGVWDELQSAHTTTGTFGEYLDSAVSGVSTGGVSAADIADAVWDEATAGHVTGGTFGKLAADTKTKTDFLPSANAGFTNGLMINGANEGAVSFADGWTISNAAGSALELNGGGGSQHGLAITAEGSAIHLTSTGAGDGITLNPGIGGTGIRGNLVGNITGNLSGSIGAYTGNTPQTGDAYARLGANGAGLSAVPWNAAWDAEVQSECADALVAYDPPTKAELDTAVTGLSTLTAAQVNAEVDTALSDVGLTLTVTGRIDAAVSTRATPAQVNAEFLDVLNVDTLIDGKTFVAATRIIAALVGGEVSGAGTGEETFIGLNGSSPRVVVTVDENGNRTTVAYP